MQCCSELLLISLRQGMASFDAIHNYITTGTADFNNSITGMRWYARDSHGWTHCL